MRILLIHQFYLRSGEGGGSRFNEMVRLWQERGHEVKVLAGQVSYTSGARPKEARTFWREEGQHGEEVYRLYTPETYQRGVLGRAWSVGGFAASALSYLTFRQRKFTQWADAMIVTSPPLTLGVVPWWVKRSRGALPVVFEVRDLWPESAVATGALREGTMLLEALYRLEELAYRHADRIVALTPAIAEDIARRGLARREHIHIIPNGADDAMLSPLSDVSQEQIARTRDRLGWGKDQFVVLYAGAHGMANDLMQMVDAATLAARDETLRDHVVWALIGDGPQKKGLMEEAKRRGLENIRWHDGVGRAEIQQVFDAADCGAAILRRTETFKTVYPNKIFDAMSRGKPVVCGVDGAARMLVEQSSTGVYFEPGDAEQFVHAVRHLHEDRRRAAAYGERGRALIERDFARRDLARRYEALLQEIASKRGIAHS